MFTTRIRPKISEKPLATMKRRPANVSASSRIRRNEPESSSADPYVVVRQSPKLPSSGGGFEMHEHVEDREQHQRGGDEPGRQSTKVPVTEHLYHRSGERNSPLSRFQPPFVDWRQKLASFR